MSDTKAVSAERTIQSLKKFFTVTWKTMDTSLFTSYRSLSQLGFLERVI